MKKNIVNAPPIRFLASLAASLAAAGLLLCGSATQAQPTISALSLPNAVNFQGPFYSYAIGTVQLQGAAPLANVLTFTVSSSTSVTALTITLTATNLPGQPGLVNT